VQVLDWQVESRLRQLEGKLLGSESAQPRGKAEPQKYDAGRQGASGALPTAPKAYNADADVVMEPAKPEKKVSNALVVFCSCVVLCCVVLCCVVNASHAGAPKRYACRPSKKP